MDVKQAAVSLQSSYLATVADSESSKVQQYLRMREAITPDTYDMAPYLRAVGGWRQRKRLAQLRAGSQWLGWESGRSGSARVPREQRICQRCISAKSMMRGT